MGARSVRGGLGLSQSTAARRIKLKGERTSHSVEATPTTNSVGRKLADSISAI